ncbi:MAG: hypothetical protein WCJ75_14405 [Desulfomonile sp.]
MALSQGIQQTPYSASDAVRRGWSSVSPDLTPSNPLGLPGSSVTGPRGSDSISISSGMFQGLLPNVPNLQLGYNYTFGPKFRAGSASVDYMLPFKLGAGSTIYGEAHGEFQSLSIAQPGSPNNCMELCFGGGYRRMFGGDTMIGLHGFYDKTRLSGNWYSSGSAGVEMSAMVAGHDAIDLNCNWYGQAFDASLLSNSLGFNAGTSQVGFGNSNYDFQAGYSHELYDGGPDLRLSVTGYKFDTSSNVYGYYGGAELKSRDGVFLLKYDVGYDNTSQTFQSVSAFINTGFQLENLIAGKSPFLMPKPVFQSPRNVTQHTEAKVNRNFRHNTQAAILAHLSETPSTCTNCQTVTVVNNRSSSVTLYLGINNGVWGNYTLADFPGFQTDLQCNLSGFVLSMTLQSGASIPICFCTATKGAISIALSPDMCPWGDCPQTLGEFTFIGADSKDTLDISLVNGFMYPMSITSWATTKGSTVAEVTQATGNQNQLNVYPLSCDVCTAAVGPPTWAQCQQPPFDQSQCKPQDPSKPPNWGLPPCHTGYPMGANYTVNIN